MKYKRQLVSGMLAISLLTSGTTAFAAETAVRPSKVPVHVNQIKMKSADSKIADSKNLNEKKNADGKVIEKKKTTTNLNVKPKAKPSKTTKKDAKKANVKTGDNAGVGSDAKLDNALIKTN